jgi:hypothetical protein
MVDAFPVVLYAVTAIGVALGLTQLWPFRAANDTGHTGQVWIAHPEDLPLDQQPDPSANDEPIAFRPLRPRA